MKIFQFINVTLSNDSKNHTYYIFLVICMLYISTFGMNDESYNLIRVFVIGNINIYLITETQITYWSFDVFNHVFLSELLTYKERK